MSSIFRKKLSMNIKLFTDRLVIEAKDSFERSESLTVASINSTLIAVLFASISAYMAFSYNAIQQTELRAIEEAEKINNIDFVIRQSPFPRLDSSEVFDKKKIEKDDV